MERRLLSLTKACTRYWGSADFHRSTTSRIPSNFGVLVNTALSPRYRFLKIMQVDHASLVHTSNIEIVEINHSPNYLFSNNNFLGDTPIKHRALILSAICRQFVDVVRSSKNKSDLFENK